MVSSRERAKAFDRAKKAQKDKARPVEDVRDFESEVRHFFGIELDVREKILGGMDPSQISYLGVRGKGLIENKGPKTPTMALDSMGMYSVSYLIRFLEFCEHLKIEHVVLALKSDAPIGIYGKVPEPFVLNKRTDDSTVAIEAIEFWLAPRVEFEGEFKELFPKYRGGFEAGEESGRKSKEAAIAALEILLSDLKGAPAPEVKKE